MKGFILGGVAAILTATRAFGVLAVPGSLADYIALGPGGASIGSTLFSDFMLLPLQTGATQIPASSILVIPINLANNPALQFVVSQTANTGELFEMRISYKVADASITGAGVALNGSLVNFDGANTALLDLTGPVPQQTLIAFDIGLTADNPVSTTFASVAMLTAEMDLVVDGGTFGSATLASATNGFTVSSASVPEPASAGVGFALFGVLIAFRHRERKRPR